MINTERNQNKGIIGIENDETNYRYRYAEDDKD